MAVTATNCRRFILFHKIKPDALADYTKPEKQYYLQFTHDKGSRREGGPLYSSYANIYEVSTLSICKPFTSCIQPYHICTLPFGIFRVICPILIEFHMF